MSDDVRIQLTANDSAAIFAEEWKKAQHQIEENKMRLEFYFKTGQSRYSELHEVRKRVAAMESWKDSWMFWLKFIAWSIFVVWMFFLITTAAFVLGHKDIRDQYLHQISDPLAVKGAE